MSEAAVPSLLTWNNGQMAHRFELLICTRYLLYWISHKVVTSQTWSLFYFEVKDLWVASQISHQMPAKSVVNNDKENA